MRIIIRIEEGGVIPLGYGLAWRRWDTLTAVCAPMPLHLIIRLARDAYFRFMWLWSPAKWENLLIKATLRGYEKGRSGKGITHGFDETPS